MALSHPSPTVTHTFNPYLPLVGRLLDVLLMYGPPGTAIETCNRTLARQAQCSAGAIPATLRKLETDGYIERVVTAHGSLIVVTRMASRIILL
jgi:CTP-dependent riboflavin kinase